MTSLSVEPVADLRALREEWSGLPVRSIFATFEWAEAWWRHFGSGRRLLLHAGRGDGGRLEVVLPLYLARERPLRIVRFLGGPQADESGPIGPAAAPDAAAALGQALGTIPHDLFIGDQLPGDESWPALLHGRLWRRESGPVLRSPGGWDAYVRSRSANLREQLRRRERRLHERHRVELRLAEDPAGLDRDLDLLFALHRARWGAASGFGPEPFHREIARLALARGRLRLWLLELDGRPAAAWYGFRVGGVESYYQAGRDPDFDADAAGFVLLAHTVRAALEDGVSEYRFLRGPEAFKRRLATGDPGYETVARARTPLGSAALAGGLALKQARARGRSMIR